MRGQTRSNGVHINRKLNFFTKRYIERKLVHTSGINLTGNVSLTLLKGAGARWEVGTNHGGQSRGPIMLHVVLSFWVVSFLYIAQINPVTPSPSHSATESWSFLFNVKDFPRTVPILWVLWNSVLVSCEIHLGPPKCPKVL